MKNEVVSPDPNYFTFQNNLPIDENKEIMTNIFKNHENMKNHENITNSVNYEEKQHILNVSSLLNDNIDKVNFSRYIFNRVIHPGKTQVNITYFYIFVIFII